jgi:hypothetical protein
MNTKVNPRNSGAGTEALRTLSKYKRNTIIFYGLDVLMRHEREARANGLILY